MEKLKLKPLKVIKASNSLQLQYNEKYNSILFVIEYEGKLILPFPEKDVIVFDGKKWLTQAEFIKQTS